MACVTISTSIRYTDLNFKHMQPGEKLGPYEILGQLGAGGMGDVFKARDSRLDRIVAVKVSREQFSERFEREARAVAALNHPHICTLHDVGPNYLVMEYIEGHTLKGPLPLPQALLYASQICDALDAAHKRGIVHRDLKPANIMVTRSGIKLLDFGLAKLAKAAAVGGQTETMAMTDSHTILGTLGYMSPEQLEGKDADPRSDIFSFGAVLYEMVTGRRAFEGSSQASVIAAILGNQPPAADAIPARLDHVMRRCLEKDPERRWESARDVRLQLEWAGDPQPAGPPSQTGIRRRWFERGAWFAAVVLSAFAPWFWPRQAANEVVRFSIYPPDGTTFASPRNTTVSVPQFEVSPDGRWIVLVASPPGGKPSLWLRSLNEVAARMIPGTEGAEAPFWAPDSRWIGFFSEDKLKKVPVGGGLVQVFAEGLSDTRGVTWGTGNTILIAQGVNAIGRIPASGGTITPAVNLAANERSHRWPHLLPHGNHFVFWVQSEKKEVRGIYAGSLHNGTRKFLMSYPGSTALGSAVFAPPGHLLFLNDDTLVAQPFDAGTLSLRDQPYAVAERVGRSSAGKIAVSASWNGVLAHAQGMFRQGRLVWFDQAGRRLSSPPIPEGDYTDFRLAPDDKRLAVSMVDRKTGSPDIWLVDEARGGAYRFTAGQGLNAGVMWSPTGEDLVFRSNRAGVIEFWRKSAGGGGSEAVVISAESLTPFGVLASTIAVTDWSARADSIVWTGTRPGTGYDVWLLSPNGERKAVKYSDTPFDEIHGNFSADGKLLAYSSNESGKFEVYVQTFPKSDRKWQISINGGWEPRWRRDGQEIYYLSDDRKLMAVPVAPGPSFGVPKILFQTRVPADVHPLRTNYVVSADGKRFLVNTQNDQPPLPITVVLNWDAALKQ